MSILVLILGIYLITFRPSIFGQSFDIFTLGAVITFLAIFYFFDAQ